MGRKTISEMVSFTDEGPSFLERMNEDQYKRQETKWINAMKKDAKDAGKRFRDPRQPRKKNDQNEPPEPGKCNPKVVTHESWKTREKQRYDGVWGPLGW